MSESAANPNIYFHNVAAARALLVPQEDATQANVLLSLETQGMGADLDLPMFARESLLSFLRLLRGLSVEDREILLEYLLLGKSQYQIGDMHFSTQTMISTRIRESEQFMGSMILFRGHPTEQAMAAILSRAGLENLLSTPTSKLAALFMQTRNFEKVADEYVLPRPQVRRCLRETANQLRKSTRTEERALGAYLWRLVDKASAYGQGMTERELRKQGDIFRKDSELLGEFRIDVTHPDFDQVFSPRARHAECDEGVSAATTL